jgi:hypothetical protein
VRSALADAGRELLSEAADALAAGRSQQARIAQERRFPIQRERGAEAHPLLIPWSVAEKAYSVYAARYGRGQSLERLAERGGFAPSEMDDFHPTWREEASEIATLKACAEADRAALDADRLRLRAALESDELIEAVAAWDHSAWAGWMRYLFSKAQTRGNGDYLCIPRTWWTRWLRQVNTSYADLSEREKDSDRKEARALLAVIKETVAALSASLQKKDVDQ